MRAKKLFGATVLDKRVKEIGRIEDIEVEIESGSISSIVVSLKKGLFSNDVIEIDFDNIATVGDYVLLNTEIGTEKEEEKEEKESKEVTIEVEDEDE